MLDARTKPSTGVLAEFDVFHVGVQERAKPARAVVRHAPSVPHRRLRMCGGVRSGREALGG